jgi:hypothetical protein
MKFYIFDTPGYTKKDWHTGKTILSRNGQTKGYGNPGSRKFDRRVSAAQAMHSVAGVRGTVNFRGKKMTLANLYLSNNGTMHQSFGGEEARERARQQKIQATEDRLKRFVPQMGTHMGGSEYPMNNMNPTNARGYRNEGYNAGGEYLY